ncbi:hypothetical protein [Lacticaseibacillus saniviri]
MLFFKRRSKKTIQESLATVFTAPGIYYVYMRDHEQTNNVFQRYVKQFVDAGIMKDIGLISQTDTAIIPYLTVRSNLMVNQHKVPFDILPEFIRTDKLFLENPATDLSIRQQLDIQFFRSVLANKRYMFMADGLDNLSTDEARDFLTTVVQPLAAIESSLIILTTDKSLVEANPKTGMMTAPTL